MERYERYLEIAMATLKMCETGNEDKMKELGLSDEAIEAANYYYWENKISNK